MKKSIVYKDIVEEGTNENNTRHFVPLFISILLKGLACLFKSRVELAAENTFLRYQLCVLNRNKIRVPFQRWDRIILVWLSRLIPHWKTLLLIVQPETLIRWHRKGFSLYWGWWFSRHAGGRNPLHPNAVNLIQEISKANPLWGTPRIHGELLKLGINVSEGTVDKYRFRRRGPRNQNWKTFLNNHMDQSVAMDFFIVPTVRFRMLWALVILSHDRREIIYTAVTHRPSAPWTKQQLRNAFPYSPLPKYILHDRDHAFRGMGKLGMEEIVTGYRSPWQNAYVERVIGSIRRECTDHLIVMGERHLTRILQKYSAYYNRSRTHLSLNKDSPLGRRVEKRGKIHSISKVGGLHHVFYRKTG